MIVTWPIVSVVRVVSGQWSVVRSEEASGQWSVVSGRECGGPGRDVVEMGLHRDRVVLRRELQVFVLLVSYELALCRQPREATRRACIPKLVVGEQRDGDRLVVRRDVYAALGWNQLAASVLGRGGINGKGDRRALRRVRVRYY